MTHSSIAVMYSAAGDVTLSSGFPPALIHASIRCSSLLARVSSWLARVFTTLVYIPVGEMKRLTENSSHFPLITSKASCRANPPRLIPVPFPSLPKPSARPLLPTQDRNSSSASPTALRPNDLIPVDSDPFSAVNTAGTPAERMADGFRDSAADKRV